MTQQAKENYKPTTLINIVVMCSEKYWEPKLNSTLKDLNGIHARIQQLLDICKLVNISKTQQQNEKEKQSSHHNWEKKFAKIQHLCMQKLCIKKAYIEHTSV